MFVLIAQASSGTGQLERPLRHACEGEAQHSRPLARERCLCAGATRSERVRQGRSPGASIATRHTILRHVNNMSGRTWVDQHWRSLLSGAIGILLGGIVGWWAGSASACERCQANTAGIEALGTWVGGIGTVAAVGFAVVAFRSEENSRRDLERRLLMTRREQDEHDRLEAEKITIRFSVRSYLAGDLATALLAQIHNGTSTTDVFKLSGKHEDFGTIGFTHKLEAGQSYDQNFLFGHMNGARPDPLQLPSKDLMAAWIQDQVQKIEISFELGGKRWSRVGGNPVEELP